MKKTAAKKNVKTTTTKPAAKSKKLKALKDADILLVSGGLAAAGIAADQV